MRYYVNFIENTVNGENRTQPKAFDTLDAALASYHLTMGQDIKAENVLGAQAIVWNSSGKIYVNDTWGVMINQPQIVIEIPDEDISEEN